MKEPLLLLPGMMCDARLFALQTATFSASMPVINIPLVGYDNFKDMAEQVLENAPNKFALAGLSMGGIAAMEIMRLAPHRVTRLALMDTNHLPDSPERRAVRDVQIAKVQGGGLIDIMRNEMKPNYLATGSNRIDILELCMEMAQTLGPNVFINQSKALQSRRNQSDTLRQINVPTLITCGREDVLCPVENHKLIHSLVSGSELSIIEGAGHLPVLENARDINKKLQKWLNRSG